jgi:hypothetical protein
MDDTFQYFSNLKELNLQGCCGHWKGGHHFTDKLFDYLTNLEKFRIDDNHVITDQGIEKLVKIKDLYIHNCCNITENSLSKLTSLIKLDLYNFRSLPDNVFKNLINLEELKMTFCHNITFVGITYLQNLKKLECSSCNGVTCKDFDKLKKLSNVSFISSLVCDADLVYLKNVKELLIYLCDIYGVGFKHLENIEVLSIYNCPINHMELDDVITHKNFKRLDIYRCFTIFNEQKQLLKEKLGTRLRTD